jgi:acetyl esterase/lipase
MPGTGAVNPEKEYPPDERNIVKIKDVSSPTCILFAPSPSKRPAPVAIICPGGAYSVLAWNLEGTEVAQWLNSLGVAAVLLKYRVPNNREGALCDLQRAIRLVRFHAAQWNLDPHRLGVIGFSAGGHLAARLTAKPDKAAYTAVDEIDRVSAKPDFLILCYPAYLEIKDKLAPEVQPSNDMPPILIVCAEDDLHFFAGSKIYDRTLTSLNIPHRILIYPTGGHGFGLRSQQAARVWPAKAFEWLRQEKIVP